MTRELGQDETAGDDEGIYLVDLDAYYDNDGNVDETVLADTDDDDGDAA